MTVEQKCGNCFETLKLYEHVNLFFGSEPTVSSRSNLKINRIFYDIVWDFSTNCIFIELKAVLNHFRFRSTHL